MTKESFKPISNTPPESFFGAIKFYSRFLLDLQFTTVYSDMVKFSTTLSGKTLDVGCGASPYKHIIDKKSSYLGIDRKEQRTFGYHNKDVIYFKGDRIPLKTGSINNIVCTEVMEHVLEPETLLEEMKRVLKKGGRAFVTIPWSARNHYVPNDYHRYTSSMLKILFHNFGEVKIHTRGTDISVIFSKIIVTCIRAFIPDVWIKILFLPVSVLLFIPLIFLSAICGHISLLFGFGSNQDPLGYTVIARK